MVLLNPKYCLFLFILIPCFLKADYITPKLYEMIFEAEEIVVGEIVCIDEEVIEVKIERSTSFEGNYITFSKFKDWECGIRWTRYEVGQRALFFLKTNNERLRVTGGGNEGEFPLIDQNLFIHNDSIALYYYETAINNKFIRSYEFWQNPFNGYKMNLGTFWKMIQSLKSCFTITEWDKYCGMNKIVSTCEQPLVNAEFGKHQPLFDWMFHKVMSKAQIQ